MNCHGCFSTASCLDCKRQMPGKDIEEQIFSQTVPYCECGGIIKPDIVFFGESLPKTFDELFNQDRKLVDLVIVMGSSLAVAPVADMICTFHDLVFKPHISFRDLVIKKINQKFS